MRHQFFYTLTLLLIVGCQTYYYPTKDEPATVSALTSMPKAQHIALLLPLSGKHADSAKAIREGFLASFYDQNIKPTVRIYDTTLNNDVQKVYETALSEGADFVVGPLVKEEVLRLSQLPAQRLKTPILALNYHSQVSFHPQFYQFALSPENEAQQVAQKARQLYRNAGILVPNNPWGKRLASAFANEWQQQGGRMLQTVYVNDNQAAVKQLLGIDSSQRRANQIKNLLTEKIEFQLRRRHDLEVILMAVSIETARQLKPLLDFYYAEDIAVYAISSIYNAQLNAPLENDLNGIIFCDMPSLISGKIPSVSYPRLYLMGKDAYHLIQALHFHQLAFQGATGYLYLENNQVKRQLPFAKIVNGAALLLNE